MTKFVPNGKSVSQCPAVSTLVLEMTVPVQVATIQTVAPDELVVRKNVSIPTTEGKAEDWAAVPPTTRGATAPARGKADPLAPTLGSGPWYGTAFFGTLSRATTPWPTAGAPVWAATAVEPLTATSAPAATATPSHNGPGLIR